MFCAVNVVEFYLGDKNFELVIHYFQAISMGYKILLNDVVENSY